MLKSRLRLLNKKSRIAFVSLILEVILSQQLETVISVFIRIIMIIRSRNERVPHFIAFLYNEEALVCRMYVVTYVIFPYLFVRDLNKINEQP